jgi:uncharacterized membrane protein
VTVKSVDHSISFRLVEDTKEADENGKGVFQLKVKNLAEKSDIIRLSAEESVEFSDEEFTLGPDSERTISMTVTSNRDLDIPLTAWAGQFPFYATAKLTMAPTFDVALSTTKNALSGAPGTSVNYILVITNEGNGQDTITMDYSSEMTWVVEFTPLTLDLHPGTSDMVIVKVKIPSTAAAGNNMVLDVTATSSDAESVGRVTLTTTVIDPPNPNPPTTEGDSDDGLPGFDLVLVIAGIAIAGSIASFRRRH